MGDWSFYDVSNVIHVYIMQELLDLLGKIVMI